MLAAAAGDDDDKAKNYARPPGHETGEHNTVAFAFREISSSGTQQGIGG